MTHFLKTLTALGSTLLIGATAWAQDSSLERYIVKYETGSKSVVESQITQMNGEIKLSLEKHRLFSVEMLPEDMNRLGNVDEIEFIEIDAKNFLFSETTEYGIPMMNAGELVLPEAAMTDRKVCIIDTGFDYTHPDLQSNRITGDDGIPVIVNGQQVEINGVPQFTNDTGDWWNDEVGHGTFMGGIIAALGNNNQGYTSVNPGDRLNLHIVKTFITSGPLTFWVYTSNSIAAVDQCVAAGANIINMSYGRSTYSLAENQGLSAAAATGVLLIAAAGNSSGITPKYPATLDAVMGVSSVDSLGYPSVISQYHLSNEISAPGGYIFPPTTPVPTPLPANPPITLVPAVPTGTLSSTYLSNGYSSGNGTSISAAYVSGVAAKLWGRHPTCTAWEIRTALNSTSTDKGPVGRDRYYGYGIVDALAADTDLGYFNCNVPTPAQLLINGGTQPGLGGAPGAQLNFAMAVGSGNVGPSAASNSQATSGVTGALKVNSSAFSAQSGPSDLSFVLTGGTGNADLYVRYGDKPTLDNYDCRSNGTDRHERCDFPTPQEGGYYVMVHGASQFNGVSLLGSYTSAPPVNEDPVASFTTRCTELECFFDGRASSDSDGQIMSYSWDYGDGSTGTGIGSIHNFASAGIYNATLTVTDDAGASSQSSLPVEVTETPTASINLVVRTIVQDRKKRALLAWNGATTRKVDIYINGKFAGRTQNDGRLIRRVPRKAKTMTYQICDHKSKTSCSEDVTVRFE